MRARIAILHSPGPPGQMAQAIADELRLCGVEVVVQQADRVDALEDFDSAVVCGALGPEGWRDEAMHLLGRFRRPLAHMSVAYGLSVPAGLDVRDPHAVQRALKFPLDRYNELRPLRVGLFHLEQAGALEAVKTWTRRLKPNFVGPDLGPPGALREILERHPLERVDQSRAPIVPHSPTEQSILRGDRAHRS